jgi:hypothetical protein
MLRFSNACMQLADVQKHSQSYMHAIEKNATATCVAAGAVDTFSSD